MIYRNQRTKKLNPPLRVEATGASTDLKCLKSSQRLQVSDRKSGFTFPIDTRSDISLTPVETKFENQQALFVLYAANNSHINAYGRRTLDLNLGLRRSIFWDFCLADVPYPIIEADLLSAYGLSVDLRNQKLVDNLTECKSPGCTRKVDFSSVSVVDKTCSFSKIWLEFPEIIVLKKSPDIASNGVMHHITTSGTPVAERARRLALDKLTVAKAHFMELQKAGHCRPSKSPWAAPLHMNLKKWRMEMLRGLPKTKRQNSTR